MGGVGLMVTGGIAPNRAGTVYPMAAKLTSNRETRSGVMLSSLSPSFSLLLYISLSLPPLPPLSLSLSLQMLEQDANCIILPLSHEHGWYVHPHDRLHSHLRHMPGLTVTAELLFHISQTAASAAPGKGAGQRLCRPQDAPGAPRSLHIPADSYGRYLNAAPRPTQSLLSR